VLVRVTAVVLTRANEWTLRLRGPTSGGVLKAQLDRDFKIWEYLLWKSAEVRHLMRSLSDMQWVQPPHYYL